MRQLRWFIAVALLLGTIGVMTAFILQNSDSVRIELPFARPFEQSLWLVVLEAFFAGALAASAGLLFQLARKSLAMRRTEKRVKGLQAEVDLLRAASGAIAAGDGAPPIRKAP